MRRGWILRRGFRLFILTIINTFVASAFAQDVDLQMVKTQDTLAAAEARIREFSRPADCSATLVSARRTAALHIGGEINTDYIATIRDRGPHRDPDGVAASTQWALHSTNLRFTMDLGNGITGRIKLDLSENQPYLQQQILEEAQLIWKNICGGPFGVVFGKGEVPYGQDRTLGIIQSYHHNDGSYSAEGRTVLNGPVPGMYFGDTAAGAGPVWHPGETDRVVMAGITFDWQDTLRFEAAVYQPTDYPARRMLVDDSGFESLAARLWWQTPVEGLVAEISGIRKFHRNRGDSSRFGPHAREDSYAFSVGADYFIPGTPLELFAEYEMGINWNFQTGYDTHTVSVGGLYQLTNRIELGLMAEWLRIDAPCGISDYNKFVAHTKYTFSNRMYLIGEYGLETYNWGGATAHVIAVRSGIDF